MTTSLLSHAGRAARKALNIAAPALVLGLVFVSLAQARINYPPGAAGRLQRAIDDILIKERADILLQGRLITQQDQANNRINVLQQQLDQATDPAVIARLERQIAQQQALVTSLQGRIDRNTLVLQNNLDVVNPRKDRLIGLLSTLPRPRNQIQMFIQAATLQQNTYAAVMRIFLNRRPISPVVGGGF